LDQRESFIGYFLEEEKIIVRSEDEVVDSVETAVGTKVNTQLLKTAGG
jgi:hypothetical protein